VLGVVRGHAVLPARAGPLAARGLRGLRSSEGKLKHLGITAPSRSTLAYANEHRPWQLSRAVFESLLLRCEPLAQGRRKFRFQNRLVSLDSTVIDLCAALFDWAQFRRTKGAVKLHCLLDHDGYLPSMVVITEGKRPDVRVARTLRFDPGTHRGDGPGVHRLCLVRPADGPGR
jgi:hypothetical protein